MKIPNTLHVCWFTEPTGAPLSVTFSVISRIATFSWDPIECSERKGNITGYIVQFLDVDRTRIPGYLKNRTFNVGGLTLDAEYTFQVAGVNVNGRGPYTTPIFIKTIEGGMPFCAIMKGSNYVSHTFHKLILYTCIFVQ